MVPDGARPLAAPGAASLRPAGVEAACLATWAFVVAKAALDPGILPVPAAARGWPDIAAAASVALSLALAAGATWRGWSAGRHALAVLWIATTLCELVRRFTVPTAPPGALALLALASFAAATAALLWLLSHVRMTAWRRPGAARVAAVALVVAMAPHVASGPGRRGAADPAPDPASAADADRERALEATLARRPDYAPAIYDLALLRARQGRWPDVSVLARKALDSDRERQVTLQAVRLLARALIRNKKLDDADRELADMIRRQGVDAELLCLVAELRERQGKQDEARSSYEEALRLNPDHEAAKKGLERLGSR
jgi:tetratricopeptide (TPR) repeat protein